VGTKSDLVEHHQVSHEEANILLNMFSTHGYISISVLIEYYLSFLLYHLIPSEAIRYSEIFSMLKMRLRMAMKFHGGGKS